MGKVIVDITVSLDGLICEPNDDLERIHSWLFNDVHETDAATLAEMMQRIGAVIMGHNTFDDGVKKQGWAGWVDVPPFAVPIFVLAHTVPARLARGQTAYTFITDGIESALAEAQAVAGGKDVLVMGGANTVQQYLKAGLIEELTLHVVPVMLVQGKRLLENLGSQRIEWQPTRIVQSPHVTHLQYRINNQ